MPPVAGVNFRKTGTVDTFNVPSPNLWGAEGGCPWDRIKNGELAGSAFYDDFESLPLAPTLTTQIAFGQYKAFATSGETISGISAVNSVDLGGGILKLTQGTAGNSTSIASAYPFLKVSGDATKDGPLWFEACVAVKSVVTLHQAFFLGLAETNLFTLATGVPFSSSAGNPTNGGACLGFFKPSANTTTLNSTYNDRATSFTAVGTGEVTGLAAFTFTKLGFVYNPAAPTKMVRFYQDNIELASYLKPSDISGTTNLKANSLGLLLSIVGGSATSSDEFYMKWWRAAQLQA